MFFRYLVALILLCASTGTALAQKRLALLIGNANYTAAVGRLKNPVNDVQLIAASLRKIGFAKTDIRIIRNAKRRQLLQAIDEHGRRLRSAGPDAISFVYYSGHGVANPEDNRNYLIPVEVEKLDANVWYDAVPLDSVVSKLSRLAREAAHFVIFDACRNLLNLPTKGSKGFVPVASRRGMLIAFSTDPGKTASDEGNGSGPYASALAAELVKPGLDHLDIFQNVRETVYGNTRSQVPWERNGLLSRIYFTPKSDDPTDARATAGSQTDKAGKATSKRYEIVFWESIRASKDPADFRDYLKQFPNGVYASLARRKAKKLTRPERIASSAAPAVVPKVGRKQLVRCRYTNPRLRRKQSVTMSSVECVGRRGTILYAARP